MDATRFDRLTRALTAAASRRGVLTGVYGVLGLSAVLVPSATQAKKKKKLKKNEYGCVDVGGKCRGNSSNCCSGICEGKKPKKGKKDKSRCIAHNVLNCPVGASSCPGDDVLCGESGFGACYQTTGQAPFCGAVGNCLLCTKDEECEAQGLGPGAACVVCLGSCSETGGRMCFSAAAF